MGTWRQIIHVDMDAFYASVEQRDNPQLAGKPVVVGGSVKSRGVVAAASYEARRFGIHSAMPMARAVKLCSNLIVLPVRMERYAEISERIHLIFERYTPVIETISLDEAFLDVTGSVKLFDSAEKIAIAIKNDIKKETGLTASVGVAINKLLAKIASDLKKPDGLVIITEENKQEILDPLPVGKLWGVGKVTEKSLHLVGIYTIGQLRKKTAERLQTIVGSFAEQLLEFAHGIDKSEVEPYRPAKSISTEQTFEADTDDKNFLLDVLLSEVETVAARLREEDVKAKTFTIKFRYGDFRSITRSKTISEPDDSTAVLWKVCQDIFEQWYLKERGPLRLIGFEASHFATEDTGQMLLFGGDKNNKQKRLDQAVDKIRKRYGDGSVRRKY
jgi:DNA polymerase-4